MIARRSLAICAIAVLGVGIGCREQRASAPRAELTARRGRSRRTPAAAAPTARGSSRPGAGHRLAVSRRVSPGRSYSSRTAQAGRRSTRSISPRAASRALTTDQQYGDENPRWSPDGPADPVQVESRALWPVARDRPAGLRPVCDAGRRQRRPAAHDRSRQRKRSELDAGRQEHRLLVRQGFARRSLSPVAGRWPRRAADASFRRPGDHADGLAGRHAGRVRGAVAEPRASSGSIRSTSSIWRRGRRRPLAGGGGSCWPAWAPGGGQAGLRPARHRAHRPSRPGRLPGGARQTLVADASCGATIPDWSPRRPVLAFSVSPAAPRRRELGPRARPGGRQRTLYDAHDRSRQRSAARLELTLT